MTLRLPGSIRLNLFLIILASILPVLWVVVSSGIDRRQHEINDARRTSLRLAEYLAARQEEETLRLRTVLEALAQHPAVKGRDYPAANALFQNVLAANPGYVNFALFNSEGEAVASALPFTRQNLSKRKEIAEALAGAAFSVGEYSIGRVSGEQVLPFATAVKDDSGTVAGVVLATQRLQEITNLFLQSQLPEGSFVGLVDHHGVRLYRYPPLSATPVGVAIATTIWEKIKSSPGLTSFSDTGTDNVAREYAVRRVSLSQGGDPYLYIFVSIPRSVLLQKADAVTLRYGLWLVFSLLLASIMAYLVARYGIHDPLARVLAVSRKIGMGDLAARTGLEKAGGSIGNLATAIDDMAASLERDQAGRDRAEQEITRQKMLLNSLIEAITDAIFIKDLKGRYLIVNTEGARVFGKAVEEIIGHDVSVLLPKDEADLVKSIDRDVMESGETRTFQQDLSTARGVLTYLVVKGPLRNEQGEVVGLFGIYRDITEQLKVRELMLQTEKMMSVGGLAAGMAHEINNPLSGILQNVQVASRRLTQELSANLKVAGDAGCSFEAIKYFMERRGILASLESIREAGVRAAHIVSSMLDFCRKSDKNFAPADMNALLDKTLELCATDYDLKKKYDFKSIAILRQYDLNLPPVICMETQIQQVFMNILANAAQAMAHTPAPALTLRTRLDAGHAWIEIEDNGPGMTEEVRKHVFEPFYTTKPVGEGTGLGLSVSYFIVVNHHQGTLAVESAPGQGTRFTIRLPFAPPTSDSTAGGIRNG